MTFAQMDVPGEAFDAGLPSKHLNWFLSVPKTSERKPLLSVVVVLPVLDVAEGTKEQLSLHHILQQTFTVEHG